LRISFNLISCGLANNGGSQTLIESANTLQELGHDVTIVDGGKNLNTWNSIKCNHVIIKDIKSFPVGDVVIATGINTVNLTEKLPKDCGKKICWIRGYEIWNIPEVKLIQILKESKSEKIVNSICLQRKLIQNQIKSKIVRPGYNFDEIFPLNIRNDNKIIIGGLYNEGKKRSKKRTEWIFKVCEELKKKYKIELYMFGSDGTPKSHIDKYFKNPDIKIKNEIYNKINIWLSPSELEGLHIAPAEAMLTKACVVGTDTEMSGTEDYLINKETGLVSENNFQSFLSNVELLIKNEVLREFLGKNGRDKILSLGDRKENMKKFINVIK